MSRGVINIYSRSQNGDGTSFSDKCATMSSCIYPIRPATHNRPSVIHEPSGKVSRNPDAIISWVSRTYDCKSREIETLHSSSYYKSNGRRCQIIKLRGPELILLGDKTSATLNNFFEYLRRIRFLDFFECLSQSDRVITSVFGFFNDRHRANCFDLTRPERRAAFYG